MTRPVYRPAERFLHVHVPARIHRSRRDDRVHVIRRRDDDAVDVLLLVEHLAIVLILLQSRELFLYDLLQPVVRILSRPTFVGGDLRLGSWPDLERFGPRRRCLRPWRWTLCL